MIGRYFTALSQPRSITNSVASQWRERLDAKVECFISAGGTRPEGEVAMAAAVGKAKLVFPAPCAIQDPVSK